MFSEFRPNKMRMLVKIRFLVNIVKVVHVCIIFINIYKNTANVDKTKLGVIILYIIQKYLNKFLVKHKQQHT